MSEEKKKNPKLDVKKLVRMNKPIQFTVKSAKPIKTGDGQYGAWHLWAGEVDNLTVENPDTKAPMPNYSGEVIFFAPTDKFQEQLMEITKGEMRNIKIEVNKEPYEMDDGSIKGRWALKKLEGGEISTSDLSTEEQNLLSDVKEVISEGYEISYDEFENISKEENRNLKLSEERTKELYKLIG